MGTTPLCLLVSITALLSSHRSTWPAGLATARSTSDEPASTSTTTSTFGESEDYQEYDDDSALPSPHLPTQDPLLPPLPQATGLSVVSHEDSKSKSNVADDGAVSVSNEILRSENSVIKVKVDRLSGSFKKSVEKIKIKNKRVDIVFLIDASSSVGRQNFASEIKFVKKLLSNFNVSYNYTRVAVVTFSSQKKIIRHIDQISQSVEENDKCLLLNYQVPRIAFSGGGTYTYGALKEAEVIFKNARLDSKKIIFLITDGFSNGRDPIPLAGRLKKDNNVIIYSIGIQSGNYAELHAISSAPEDDHSYLLDSFDHFETLARKALHSDYKTGENIFVNSSLCDVLCMDDKGFFDGETSECCDSNATCSCSTTGHYSCICKPGFFGSGIRKACYPCPNGTFWNGLNQNQCTNCPDANHITVDVPAMNSSACICKTGYKADENGLCEVITCPELTPPENGYFVKHPSGCGQVLHAACGTRCQSGYQLVGDSIRLCQENGEWSGNDPKCVLKTCPALKIPYYGLAVCKNPDLDLFFDYSPRNKSFLTNYSVSVDRLTEPMPIDTDCTFKCGHGFYLVGSSSRNCLPLSKWDGLQTSCKQILCSPLPKIPFGQYDPTDCAEQKSAHGSNCTLVCHFGFELKGGPSTKSCGGKRNGVWTQKVKTPRCIDVTPPHLMCPNNYTLPMHDDFNYAIVKRLNMPYVFDNGGDNFTFWSKPAIKDQGTKLYAGTHLFTYIAVDSFKNKAKCNFTVEINDSTAPVIENCYDPPIFYLTNTNNDKETFIEWDEPSVFDNSNENITMTRSIDFGYHNAGDYSVVYHASDSSGNVAECTLNITVRESKCDNLPSPPNGQTVCAKNSSHTWCEVTCQLEHSFHDRDESSVLLFCNNRKPSWNTGVSSNTECTAIERPLAVEEVFTINLATEISSLCEDAEAKNEVSSVFEANLKEQLCGDQADCKITTSIPACDSVAEPDDKTKYQIVKREAPKEAQTKPRKQNHKRDDRASIKINVYTKLSKRLGMWKQDGKKSDNIKRVKVELQNINNNEQLRKRLGELNMDLSVLKLDETIRCPHGSVAKKLVCVQCPRGTYHNYTTNTCVSCPMGTYNEITGQSDCIHCPPYHSTRKPNSKHSTECKPQCPPGTIAKLKLMKKEKTQKYHKSLMPFCRRCEPGEYQGLYNRISCDKCPPTHISPRGSTSIADCVPKVLQPCSADSNVCGSHGQCVPDPVSEYLYSCTCDEGFAGSHCEKQLEICASAPCYNAGTCVALNATSFRCICQLPYGGTNCEKFFDPCSTDSCLNGGSCVEVGGHAICECQGPYEGDRCELVKNFCAPNPCENGGICSVADDGYNCFCPPGQMGKRCHLKPCDYVPCPNPAICVNIRHDITLATHFTCVCPKGLKGVNCTEIYNPCDRNPCRNNGRCTPVKLRDFNSRISNHSDLEGDELYSKVRCECAPYFYGTFCETLTTPDFVMSFEKSGTNDYIRVAGPKRNLTEISLCTWIETKDDFNYGTVISYATPTTDNAFTFTDYSGFALYVSGDHVVTNAHINDGLWHFVCLTWTSHKGVYEIYLDGKLHTTGQDLSTGKVIEGNGLFVIGQEQDSMGGSFSESESFVGKLAYFDLWSRSLAGYEVKELYYSCEPYQGDLIQWTDLKSKVVGSVKVHKSEFCRACERNLTIQNGFVNYYENRAYFNCDEGYKLHGPVESVCLRTSKWSDTSSFCKLIRCGSLNTILNGKVIISKSSFNGIARFVCDDGFYLSGDPTTRCTIHGNWSSPPPECISIVKCPALTATVGSKLIYASERGVFNQVYENYAVGTLVEVRCNDGYYLDGENLLTCLDTGVWDIPIPECMPTETVSISTELIPTSERNGPTIIKINRRPDVRFWKQLRDFLFYGCSPIDPNKKSQVCQKSENSINNLTDLTMFKVPVSADYQNMDAKLLQFLSKRAKPDANLNHRNLLDYILYGTIEQVDEAFRLPKQTEDSFRFVICLFIDIIMMDREVTFDDEVLLDISSHQRNINDKIKNLLKYVVQPIYEAHLRDQEESRQRELENQRNALKKIVALAEVERMLVQKCRLSAVPDPPIDSRIKSVETTVELRPLDLRIEKLRKRADTLNVGDRVWYGCNAGFTMKGTGYTECTPGGHWSYFDSFCEGVLCDQPPLLPGMEIAASSVDSRYYYDDEIDFRCSEGYMMQGHPIIKCSIAGKWSPIVARCTKISCGKPKITSTAKIISGSSYQFNERLKILCADKRTVETICQSNGKWSVFEEC